MTRLPGGRGLLLLLTVGGLATACSSGVATPLATSTPASPVATIALRGDGLGVVDLGAAPDPAVAAVAAVLGQPSADTGWEPSASTYGTCPGTQIRVVTWAGVVLLFTNGRTTYGSGQHLFGWQVTGAPPAIGTATGLGFGATAADAHDLYPGRVDTVPAEDPYPGFLRIKAEGGTITAFLDGADTITNLEAGVSCGE